MRHYKCCGENCLQPADSLLCQNTGYCHSLITRIALTAGQAERQYHLTGIRQPVKMIRRNNQLVFKQRWYVAGIQIPYFTVL